jgi:hydroxymethylpyrimidine/phosphomethylpyrimidine kinase
MQPVALTIAGSDPSGGAGIQADLKTFQEFGVYGTSVLTVLTVQNTVAVESVDVLAADFVRRQLEAVVDDIPPNAVKTGALGSAEIVAVVAAWARATDRLLVVDPVFVSTSGASLADRRTQAALVEELLPHALLVTPNRSEAESLSGLELTSIERVREAARRIAELGPGAVLVKGGHVELGHEAIDVLYCGGEIEEFHAPRVDTRHTHGSGCTYSAAITALLAQGRGLSYAVGVAKRYIAAAIASAPGLGAGHGPLDHRAGGGWRSS